MKCPVQNLTAGSMERGWEHLRLRRAAVPVRPEAPVLCTCAEGFPARHGREQFSTSAQKTDTVPPAYLSVFCARLRRADSHVRVPPRALAAQLPRGRASPGAGLQSSPRQETDRMRGQGPHTARMGLEGVSGAGRPRPRAQGRRRPAGVGTRHGAPRASVWSQHRHSLTLVCCYYQGLFELIKSQESKCQNVFVPEAVSLPFGSLVHAGRVCQPGTLA